MAATPPTAASLKPVIGFEVHAQLKTASKLFCGCGTAFAAPPNSLVCPVCLGLPGSLPVMNRCAVEMAVKIALALECEINAASYQARKNYFYPDLPKGYQISQYRAPIAQNGTVRYWYRDELKTARIKRVQLEEDTAKMFHEGERSLVDYNRSGVPLVEVVTEPDFNSAEEGVAYLKELRNLLRTLEVCDGNMEEGSLRCEPNVSLATGDPSCDKWKVELKNLGSFRSVERAIRFEKERQTEVLESGGRVLQETRGFNERAGETFPMRSKEFEEDYRYFADPDLPLLVFSPSQVETARAALPELPSKARLRLQKEGLSSYLAGVITSDPEIAAYYQKALEAAKAAGMDKKSIANWVVNDFLGVAKDHDWKEAVYRLPPEVLVEIGGYVESGNITATVAKSEIIRLMLSETPGSKWTLSVDLKKINDTSEIEKAVDAVLTSPEAASMIASFKKGKENALTALMGLVMRQTRGKADPKTAERLLREKLKAG